MNFYGWAFEHPNMFIVIVLALIVCSMFLIAHIFDCIVTIVRGHKPGKGG